MDEFQQGIRVSKSRIKSAIFDMDGTLFKSHLDWLQIREELQLNPGDNILKEIYLKDQVDYRRLAILEKFERENTLKTEPIDGIAPFLDYLNSKKILTILLTNNNQKNTSYLLSKFNLRFHLVITREMNLWKPEPDAFFYIMKEYGFEPDNLISIGDSHYDIKASREANLKHIFLIKKAKTLEIEDPDIILFKDYYDLKKILKQRDLI